MSLLETLGVKFGPTSAVGWGSRTVIMREQRGADRHLRVPTSKAHHPSLLDTKEAGQTAA